MVTATGTKTLGFIVWTLALTGVSWFSTVVHGYLKRQRIEKQGAFGFALRESRQGGLLLLAAISSLTLFAWLSFVPVVIYRDHESLVSRNRELLGMGEGNPYAIKANTEYASMVNTFMSFEGLKGENGLQKDRCDLKITAPSENKEIAVILTGLARSAYCFTEEVKPLGMDSTGGFPVVEGAIVIHAEPGIRGAGLANGLSNTFNVRLSHEMPPDSPPGFVWIQVGSGVVWRTVQ
jgi:hypothetical protein